MAPLGRGQVRVAHEGHFVACILLRLNGGPDMQLMRADLIDLRFVRQAPH